MKIEIDLTPAEAEKLVDTLSWAQDAGPTGEGWQSDLLHVVAGKVEDAVEAAKLAAS